MSEVEKESNQEEQNKKDEKEIIQRELQEDEIHNVIHLDGMYENWFLDYASYVILERAVPSIHDGLKPVQRRILHSMKDMDDGRFHKVANIIGQTMQFHPHGDAAIGDALVNLGQKDLLIDTQGNWGDTRTGDRAAAPRYIEARLSKFALAVVFNPDTTEWQQSYDGRKKEPVNLPVKFPLLLAQGVEGIAVGLATKIMPHNFIELIKGSIAMLNGKKTNLMPDFPNGGLADFSEYNGGKKGGKIRLRAIIEVVDKRTLLIKNIPYGTTTTGLIDSVLKANDNGKIKIKKVTDNTAKDVEILIDIPSGVSPDVTISALYAFTDCEVSISPNLCVIIDDTPHFLSVDEILKACTENTAVLLKTELEIKRDELAEKWHFSSLEKIFIEKRIYRDIEECETWEAVIKSIDKGLKPHVKHLKREVTEEDIVRLTEIKIKRISKFDAFRANEEINKLEEQIKEVKKNLNNLTEYAISYFENLQEKFGKGRERKTEIRTFDTIAASKVAVANQKLYVNRVDGFIGYGLKKDEFICECSDLDTIIAIRKDGKFIVTKIAEKTFVGKDIIHTAVWKKGDDRMVYNLIYRDGKGGKTMAKRFAVTSITRDKEYDLTKGKESSKVLYFTANPNSESEVVGVYLKPDSKARNKLFEYNFADLAIKGRGSQGNSVTKYPVLKITQKEVGESTIGGVDIWYDSNVGKLNKEQRGDYLGNFNTNDQILVILNNGNYMLTSFELINRYEPNDISIIKKFDQEDVISAVHYDGKQKTYYVKRFKIETTTKATKYSFITDHRDSKLAIVTTTVEAIISFNFVRGKQKEKASEELNLIEFIDVKGWRAIGNKLNYNGISAIKLKEVKVSAEEQPESNSKVIDLEVVQQTDEVPQEVQDAPKVEELKVEKSKPKRYQKKPPKIAAEEKPAKKVAEKETKPQEKKKNDTVEVDLGTTIEFDVSETKNEGNKKKEDDQLGLF